MLPSALMEYMPRKRFFGQFQGLAPSVASLQPVTLQLNAAWNFEDIYLVCQNVTLAMIQEARLKIGADVIQRWVGADCDATHQYDREPAFATNNVFKFPLRRMGLRGGANVINFDSKTFLSGDPKILSTESTLNCGSSGGGFAAIKDVTLELDLINTGSGQPVVQVYGRVTPPIAGGPGAVRRVDKQSKQIGNGSVVITKSEMGLDALRPYLNRIILVNPVVPSDPPTLAVFDNFQLRWGTEDYWTIPLGLLNQTQTEDNLRTLQAGYTILDFQETGWGDELLDLSNPASDILLRFDCSGLAAASTLIYYVETLGLPFSANVSA
jgi:hypothetical protein